MGNQYSITVSDETDRILQTLKDEGYKMSQVFDACVATMGKDGAKRIIADRRHIQALKRQLEVKE